MAAARNARDDNERGTSPPDDDGAGVTEHLINRDTTADPPSRQAPGVGDPSDTGGVGGAAGDTTGGTSGEDRTSSRGLTRNAGSDRD